MPNSSRRCAGFLMLVLGVLALPACSSEKPEQKLVWGQTVRGQVTHKGEPVPYGFVLFYHPEKGLDPATGKFVPVAFGEIHEGKYVLENVPAGPMIVCVATDPDMDAGMATRPVDPGGVVEGPPGLPGAPPLAPDTPDDPAGPPPGKFDNPLTQNLTAAQKQTLKALHQKYGEFSRSPLAYVITEGEQTFDIDLK
ncbi:MAG: hypothetical protein L0Z62_17685 [Gemmataceae bacterium]|nr:hypothetical protein [Gemmataceae bacterium]